MRWKHPATRPVKNNKHIGWISNQASLHSPGDDKVNVKSKSMGKLGRKQSKAIDTVSTVECVKCL